jgi:formate dehydrogenase maturation protein FdhE
MTEKIDARRRRWIEAGKILAVSPKATVACPACGQGTLQVIDAGNAEITDRYLQCPVCHAYEILTLKNPIQ